MPQQVGFGGLLDEHAPALVRALRAATGGPAHEDGVATAVGHVVADRVAANRARRQLRHLAREARGGRVDDDVPGPVVDLGESRRRDLAEVRELVAQALRALGRAVRDAHLARLLLEQRREHAARRAAGAEDQQPRAGDRDTDVPHEVGDEADAVGVLAVELGGAAADDRVDRARPLGARGEVVHDLGGRRLVRQRDVRATSALHEEVDHRVAERRRWGVDHLVVDDVVELAGEQAVDEGRPAVADGMAEEDVAARSRVARHCPAPSSHAAARPA